MSDIVERLRNPVMFMRPEGDSYAGAYTRAVATMEEGQARADMTKAADEIERLQHERDSIEIELIQKAEECERLQEAKRRALAIADERSKENVELRAERDELQSMFDLRWKADMRAIKMWQAAHPGNDNVWPDRTDLVCWLLAEMK